MRRVAAGLLASALLALTTLSGQDAQAVLSEAARVLGADALKSVRYSGRGFTYQFAQNYRPDGPYPKFNATYTRQIDFAQRLSREEIVRTQFEDPPRGGGGQPLYREAPGAVVVGDNSPWGGAAVALTPHGFVAAARAANATLARRRAATAVSFTTARGAKVTGYLNAMNLVDRIETWVANPILGDMPVVTTFADYRDVNGIKFPMRIVQQQGGFPVLELTVSEVQPNAAVTIQAPPGGAPPAPRVAGERIGDGVWYLEGTPDPNSQLIEFRDFLVIVESSVTEARALANIAEAKRLVPGKPIRYHVNSHHHGDHAAGMRAYIAEGVTIVTHAMNRRLYEQTVLTAPRTIEQDTLARAPRPARFEWVAERGKYTITDGQKTLEVHHVPNGHAANLLMSWLPHEHLLLITDIFNDFGQPRPNDPPPGIVSPYYAALGDRIRELGLDVQRLAPSHGKGALPVAVLQKALQGTIQAPLIPRRTS